MRIGISLSAGEDYDVAEVIGTRRGHPSSEELRLSDYVRDCHQCPQVKVPLIFRPDQNKGHVNGYFMAGEKHAALATEQ